MSSCFGHVELPSPCGFRPSLPCRPPPCRRPPPPCRRPHPPPCRPPPPRCRKYRPCDREPSCPYARESPCPYA